MADFTWPRRTVYSDNSEKSEKLPIYEASIFRKWEEALVIKYIIISLLTVQWTIIFVSCIFAVQLHGALLRNQSESIPPAFLFARLQLRSFAHYAWVKSKFDSIFRCAWNLTRIIHLRKTIINELEAVSRKILLRFTLKRKRGL